MKAHALADADGMSGDEARAAALAFCNLLQYSPNVRGDFDLAVGNALER